MTDYYLQARKNQVTAVFAGYLLFSLIFRSSAGALCRKTMLSLRRAYVHKGMRYDRQSFCGAELV